MQKINDDIPLVKKKVIMSEYPDENDPKIEPKTKKKYLQKKI